MARGTVQDKESRRCAVSRTVDSSQRAASRFDQWSSGLSLIRWRAAATHTDTRRTAQVHHVPSLQLEPPSTTQTRPVLQPEIPCPCVRHDCRVVRTTTQTDAAPPIALATRTNPSASPVRLTGVVGTAVVGKETKNILWHRTVQFGIWRDSRDGSTRWRGCHLRSSRKF